MGRGPGRDPLRSHQVGHLFGLQQAAILLHHIDVATQHDPPFPGEVLGLAGRGHHALIGIEDAHIARGRDHARGLVGPLHIRFDAHEPGGNGRANRGLAGATGGDRAGAALSRVLGR